jgi:hypothetical protein
MTRRRLILVALNQVLYACETTPPDQVRGQADAVRERVTLEASYAAPTRSYSWEYATQLSSSRPASRPRCPPPLLRHNENTHSGSRRFEHLVHAPVPIRGHGAKLIVTLSAGGGA